MELTGSCKEDFKNFKKWYFWLLPESTQLLIVYRWFNTKTMVGIDIQNWEGDGFDYAVSHPYLNEVYCGNKKAGNRRRNFDVNLEIAINKANEVYNKL